MEEMLLGARMFFVIYNVIFFRWIFKSNGHFDRNMFLFVTAAKNTNSCMLHCLIEYSCASFKSSECFSILLTIPHG